MSALKLYTSAKSIETATVAFAASGVTLQAEAHKLAMSVLVLFGKNHDVRIVNGFIKAMPEMSRVNALKDWFSEFGPISFGEDGKTVTHVKDKPVRVGDAAAKPFWKFSPEKPYEAMDVNKSLNSLQKKLETDAKKTGRDHSAVLHALKLIKVDTGIKAVKAKVTKTATPKMPKVRKPKVRKPKAPVTEKVTVH